MRGRVCPSTGGAGTTLGVWGCCCLPEVTWSPLVIFCSLVAPSERAGELSLCPVLSVPLEVCAAVRGAKSPN
eukprot:8931469-Prorocentrum_lima.AAC.1